MRSSGGGCVFLAVLDQQRQRRLTRMKPSRTHADGSLLEQELTRQILWCFIAFTIGSDSGSSSPYIGGRAHTS
jgi:hypothetical protein